MARQQRSAKPPAARTYTMRQRQASVDETRARIVDAAIELYETVGPTGTTMSGVAEAAGVTRATLYRHFAGDDALADAVVGAWRDGWSNLDAVALAGIADDDARLQAALTALYAGYRATDQLTATLVRDAHALPAAHRSAPREPAARALQAIGRGARSGSASSPAAAALAHAVAFETWQSLSAGHLTDAAIADLLAAFVALAGAAGPATRTTSGPKAPARGGTARPVVPTPSARAASPAAAAEPKPRKAKAPKVAAAPAVAPVRVRSSAGPSATTRPKSAAAAPQAIPQPKSAKPPRAPKAAETAPAGARAPKPPKTAATLPAETRAPKPPKTVATAPIDLKPPKAPKDKAAKKAKAQRKAERKAKGGSGANA